MVVRITYVDRLSRLSSVKDPPLNSKESPSKAQILLSHSMIPILALQLISRSWLGLSSYRYLRVAAFESPPGTPVRRFTTLVFIIL